MELQQPLSLWTLDTTGDTNAHSYHTSRLRLLLHRHIVDFTLSPARTVTGFSIGKYIGNQDII